MTGYALPAPAPPGFQLADLFALIDRRRRLILRVAGAVVLLAVLVSLALPTTWSSSAVVMLDQRRNNVTDISAVLSQLPGDPATVQNQIQILTSRELADKVIAKLGLENDPEFNPLLTRPGLAQLMSDLSALANPRNWFDDGAGIDSERIHDRILDNFAKHVSADANGLSTAITLTVTARDPAKAARIANALAAAYVGQQVTVKRDAADATTAWLNQRIHDLSQQLQVQEGAVQSYKAAHGLTDTAPGSSLVDQQLVGINSEIVQARSDVAEKQALYDRISQLAQSGDAADVSSVVSSPLIVQLRTQQTQLLKDEGDLSSKYGPLHPKMQALEQQKRDLDTKIAEEVRRIAASAGNDLTVAKAHLTSLEGSLAGARGELTGENYARVELQALESNAASTRSQYEAFVTRLRQTQDQDAVAAPESQVISAAEVPLTPSGPKRTLIVAASIPVGLLLGLLAALSLEKLAPLWPVKVDGSPRGTLMLPAYPPRPASPFQAAPYQSAPPRPPKSKPKPVPAPLPVWNGPPILADVADSAALKSGDAMIDFPASPYAHRIAALVRQLETQPGNLGGGAVVAITAVEPGEHKSGIGLSMARAAALLGKKTVLIDCDPAQAASGASQAGGASQASVRHGLYDILTGAVPLNKALVKDSRSNAYLLAMNKRPPNLSTMFASSQMRHLIGRLKGGCEMVIIDCARAGAGPEAALLARLADATVLVSRQAGLYGPALTRSVEILHSAQAAPIGIVITK